MSTLGPIVDCNVHLWDQRENPVFWLTDRTLVRDLIGDYDSLPDVYTLVDYERETAGFPVRGIVWSDAGAADAVAAAEWVQRQHEERGLVTGIVSLGDPAADGFGDLRRPAAQDSPCTEHQGAARGGIGAGRPR